MTRRALRASVAGLLAVLMIAAAGVVAGERYLRAPIGGDRVITILLLGGDEGPMRGGTVLRSRADAFHLLFVSPDRERATFVNIPRDSYVSVPGFGSTRINTCLVAGPERCVQTVESLWGLDVDHYIVTSFSGFMTAVDRYGGVPVDVEHSVRDGGEAISAGPQVLSGAQALAYTRDRKNRPGGDLGRTTAQANFLMSAHRDMFEGAATPTRIAEMVGLLQQTTVTDARADELLRYAFLAVTIDPGAVDNITLPANIGMAGAASVMFLPPAAHTIVRDVAADGVRSQ